MPKKQTKKKIAKSHKLMVLPWITMVISTLTLIFVIVSLGYLWYYSAFIEPMVQIASNQLALEQKINMLETQAITEREWDIYQDEGNNFMIQHPSSWQAVKSTDENLKLTLKSDLKTGDDYSRDITVEVYSSAKEIKENSKGLSLKNWIKEQMGYDLFIKKSEAEKNGVTAVVGHAGGYGIYYTVFFELEDGTIYEIQHSHPSGQINTVEKKVFDSFELLSGIKGL